MASDYLLVAAIDFGTSYSGYAFSDRHSFPTEPTKIYQKQWIYGGMIWNKTSTCALFNNNKKLIKFGFEAEAKFYDILLDKKENDYYFFGRFKMSLYDIETNADKIELEDVNGKTMPLLDIFSASIRYLRDSLLEECRKQYTYIRLTDIKWVITVPAIWTDSAKTLMRTAAKNAGIDPDMLMIALEPEAASLYVKYLPLQRQVDGKMGDCFQAFKCGSKYLVIDAGGGTVDITAHEVVESGKVQEILTSSGGNWGGTRVDESYHSFVEDLVGKSTLQKVQEDYKTEVFEIFHEFEVTKRSIYPHSDDKTTVKIPGCVIDVYTSVNDGKTLKSVKEVKRKNGKTAFVSMISDKLRIDSETANDFFEESLFSIINHLLELFNGPHGNEIATIIMVGRYSDSPVLTNAIRSKFPNKRVIVPYEAALSVMKGAVIFGHSPGLITKRRSKYTYGVECSEPFIKGFHDENKKCKMDGEIRCEDLFHKHVEMDELVTVGEYQSDETYGLHSDFALDFEWGVYASKSKDPKYITDKDCFKVGVAKFDKLTISPDSRIRIQMSFSHTEIEVKMTDLISGKTSKVYLTFD